MKNLYRISFNMYVRPSCTIISKEQHVLQITGHFMFFNLVHIINKVAKKMISIWNFYKIAQALTIVYYFIKKPQKNYDKRAF